MTTCWITELSPGHKPPQVTIAALQSFGLNAISDLGPARMNASADKPRSTTSQSSHSSTSLSSSFRIHVSSIAVSSALICTLAATASLRPTNHQEGTCGFSERGLGYVSFMPVQSCICSTFSTFHSNSPALDSDNCVNGGDLGDKMKEDADNEVAIHNDNVKMFFIIIIILDCL